MSSPETLALDSAQRQILQDIRIRCKRREVYMARPTRDHMEEDRKVADEIADLERRWVDARESADRKFIEMAMQKPFLNRVSMFKVRAYGVQSSGHRDRNSAERTRGRNLPIAEDYALLAEAQLKKGEVFLALAEEAQHELEAGRMAAAQGLSNKHDRDRNVRALARQYSKRAEMQAASPEEQAGHQARAEELSAGLPDKPLLGASDMRPGLGED